MTRSGSAPGPRSTWLRTWKRVIDRWRAHLKTLTNQRDRLREREKALKDKAALTDDEQETLGRVVGELRYVAGRIKDMGNEHTLGALEALGLLPNYTLFDDTVTLEVASGQPTTNTIPGTKNRGASSRGRE